MDNKFIIAKMAETPVVGIDLGTTNSVIAVWNKGEPEIISNDAQNTIPSCVSFMEHGIAVGNSALTQLRVNPKNTIFEAKRLIGKKYVAYEKEMLVFPFVVTKDDTDKPRYTVSFEGENRQFYPEEVSAVVLKQLKQNAENSIQQQVRLKAIYT